MKTGRCPGRSSGGRRKEPAFDLSLPLRVQGRDALGRKFTENSFLESISAQEAKFTLRRRVLTGFPLRLLVAIPSTWVYESPMILLLEGRISIVRAKTQRGKDQLVIVRLDKNFKVSDSRRAA